MCRWKVGVRRAEDERFSLMAIDEETRSRNQQDPAGLACLERKIQFNLMVKWHLHKMGKLNFYNLTKQYKSEENVIISRMERT